VRCVPIEVGNATVSVGTTTADDVSVLLSEAKNVGLGDGADVVFCSA
jgi:hypothetical protein